MSARPETWNPHLGVRVEPHVRDAILDLRSYLGGVETATVSATLRELIGLALVLISPGTVQRVRAIILKTGWSRDVAWSRVVEAGLSAVESDGTTPKEQ
jgi:hypothetical protein